MLLTDPTKNGETEGFKPIVQLLANSRVWLTNLFMREIAGSGPDEIVELKLKR